MKNSNSQYDFDVIVIGGGPGGYVAAIRAAQLGLKVACIDKRKNLGGTCLNVGCIPSKALLHASEQYNTIISGDLAKLGIQSISATLDIHTLMYSKQKTIHSLAGGIAHLFKKNKITFITGQAQCVRPHHIKVNDAEISAKDIIIATGSSATQLPNIQQNSSTIVDSTGALSFDSVPEHLVVIGAGAIGLELGSVWKRFGAKVTVIEFQSSILSGMDAKIREAALKAFSAQGIDFILNHTVNSIKDTDVNHLLHIEDNSSKQEKTLSASHVLIATGRRPYTDSLQLDSIGVQTNSHEFIEVNERFQTSAAHVWAIGDVTPGAMLAHRAQEEGIAVAENIAGKVGIVNHSLIPSVVYTQPEIASVGMTEEQADANHTVKVGMFPFAANSRAKINHQDTGFVKIITNANDDTVLGVHIFGPQAGTMIAQVVQAMEFGATAEDIAYTCHAHPTYAEAIKEAALSVQGNSIHF